MEVLQQTQAPKLGAFQFSPSCVIGAQVGNYEAIPQLGTQIRALKRSKIKTLNKMRLSKQPFCAQIRFLKLSMPKVKTLKTLKEIRTFNLLPTVRVLNAELRTLKTLIS